MAFIISNSGILEQPLPMLKPSFPESGWTSHDGEKQRIIYFPFPCACVPFAFALVNCNISTYTCFPSYFLSPIQLRGRVKVIKWLGGHLKSSQDQPTHILPQPLEFLIIVSYRHISCTWYSLSLCTTQLILCS